MSKIISNKGYIGLGLQSAKGAASVASDYFIKYQEDGFTTEMEITPLREGGDGELINCAVKNNHLEKFSIVALARPELMSYIWAFIMGYDSVSGVSDPYTHTHIRGTERSWLTIRRKLDTAKVQVLRDCKIEKIVIEGEAGKEIKVTIEGMGITCSTFESAEETPVYEGCKVFTFYHGQSRYKINNAATSLIGKFSISYTISSQEGLQTDGILINDLPDLKIDVDFSCELYAESIDSFFKNVNYNSGSSPSENLYSFTFSMDLRYQENVADDRQLKIDIGKIIAQPVTGINLKGEPESLKQTLAGYAVIPAAGSFFTVTCKNDISTNIISGS